MTRRHNLPAGIGKLSSTDERRMSAIAAHWPALIMDARIILNRIAARLVTAGVDTARLDARILLATALGRDDAVLPHETLSHWDDDLEDALARLADRRLAGEPVSRIRDGANSGHFAFCCLPTRWTRVLIQKHWLQQRKAGRLMSTPRFLDLGTGSGCLLLACLSELPDATGSASICWARLSILRRRMQPPWPAERADFATASFADDLDAYGMFDLVICNPPYIPAGEVATLAPEVTKFDPARAGWREDGLASWREVLPAIARRLASDGRLCRDWCRAAGRGYCHCG